MERGVRGGVKVWRGAADDPEKLLGYIRGQWSIENQLHWSLDISFTDDNRRTRTGNGAENASRLSRIALNLLKAETTLKASIKSKRLLCGWDHDYLLKVLLGPAKNKIRCVSPANETS